MSDAANGADDPRSGQPLADADAPMDPPPPSKGHWPSWKRKLLQDLLPHKFARSNDALEAPDYVVPDWFKGKTSTATLVDAAKAKADAADKRVDTADTRAAALVDNTWKLLAIAFAASGFEAVRLKAMNAGWLACLVPAVSGLFAIGSLVMALLIATGVARVGLVWPLDLQELSDRDPDVQAREMIVQLDRSAAIANWTAKHKLSEFLQARAWFTRGVCSLIVLGLCAVAIFTSTTEPAAPAKPDSPTTSSATTTPAPSATTAPVGSPPRTTNP